MIRAPKTLTMIAAAVGIPYTASETEIGQAAMRMLGTGMKSVSTPVEDFLASSRGTEFGEHAHRDVEGIWEQTIDRYRYSSTPQVVGQQSATPQGAGPTGRLVSSTSPAPIGGGSALSNTGTAVGNERAMPASSPNGPVSVGGFNGSGQPSLVGQPVGDLREVLRFDISPDWVTNRFSRVTTVLAELQLDGLRVPLVTGTGPNDLAGSVSYYFDHSGRLQRVALHGFTGDPNAIVQTMTQHYGLQSEQSLEAGVYTRRWNGIPVHFLRITRAPVVYSDALHHKFTVFLELNQPDLRYGISAEAQRIVSADRTTGRW